MIDCKYIKCFNYTREHIFNTHILKAYDTRFDMSDTVLLDDVGSNKVGCYFPDTPSDKV